MGGGWFPKLVWPKHNMINQQVKVGVANNDKRENVGVARAKLVWQRTHLPYGILHPWLQKCGIMLCCSGEQPCRFALCDCYNLPVLSRSFISCFVYMSHVITVHIRWVLHRYLLSCDMSCSRPRCACYTERTGRMRRLH